MNVIMTTCNDGVPCNAAVTAAKTAGGGPIVLPPGTFDVATTVGHLCISIAEVVVDLLVIYGALACVIYAFAAFMMWPRHPGKTR
jgi:hypothetical protein